MVDSAGGTKILRLKPGRFEQWFLRITYMRKSCWRI